MKILENKKYRNIAIAVGLTTIATIIIVRKRKQAKIKEEAQMYEAQMEAEKQKQAASKPKGSTTTKPDYDVYGVGNTIKGENVNIRSSASSKSKDNIIKPKFTGVIGVIKQAKKMSDGYTWYEVTLAEPIINYITVTTILTGWVRADVVEKVSMVQPLK